MVFNYKWTDLNKGLVSTTEVNIKAKDLESADVVFIEHVGSKCKPIINSVNIRTRCDVKNLSHIYKAQYIKNNFKLMQFSIV